MIYKKTHFVLLLQTTTHIPPPKGVWWVGDVGASEGVPEEEIE